MTDYFFKKTGLTMYHSKEDDNHPSVTSRRRFLKTAGGATTGLLTVGCTAPTNTAQTTESFTVASNPWTEYDLETSGKGLLLLGTIILGFGEYAVESFLINLDFYIDYTIEMRSTGNLDFFFMPENQFKNFREERRVDFFWQDSLSGRDDSGHGGPVGAIPSGNYVAVFDNTHMGDGQPNEQVRAEVRFLTHHCLTGKTSI